MYLKNGLSKFKWFLTRKFAGSMVQVGYDVALTRRKSRVQIPVDPYFIHKQFIQRIIGIEFV